MERIDSLLSILVQQGADELRLGTEREPKMFARGGPTRLSLPTTPEATLRELLGELFTAEREHAMRERGQLEFTYDSAAHGSFRVALSARPGGAFDVIFRRDSPSPQRHPLSAGASARQESAAPTIATSASSSSGAAPLHATTAVGTSTLAQLVASAAAMRASDVHLADGEYPMTRVDGQLRRLGEELVDVATVLEMGPAERGALAEGRSSDLGLHVAGVGRVRIHVFKTAGGIAAAVRLLAAAPPSMASLGLPVPLDDVVELAHGLVLVVGATGSGKSTTLAAMVQHALRRRSIVVSTLEDPIEYELEGSGSSVVRRRQVGRDVPSFAAGLRDALRQDPDVLLVGEMRDPETIGLALTAAETGHLVFSSLHCGSAASAIERIVDAYSPSRQEQVRVQLADSLRVVVAQRLLPRKGSSGRALAVEVLRVTHAVGALIREGKTAQITTALQAGKREGMLPLERCLADLVRAGAISSEDARQASNQPESLAMYLTR